VLFVQDGHAGRQSTKIKQFLVSNAPVGAVVTVSCLKRVAGCPRRALVYKVKSPRPLTLLPHRQVGAHAVLTVSVGVPPPQTTGPPPGETPAEEGLRLTRRLTQETRTIYRFRPSRPPTRSEVCVRTGRGGVPCLQINALAIGPLVRFVRVLGVPPEATVRYVCRGGGCPRRSRSVLTSGQSTVQFPEFRQRKLKPGAHLEILVTRPKTIGVATLLRIASLTSQRRDGCTTVDHGRNLVPLDPCPFR
jgi:hypothetical protein